MAAETNCIQYVLHALLFKLTSAVLPLRILDVLHERKVIYSTTECM